MSTNTSLFPCFSLALRSSLWVALLALTACDSSSNKRASAPTAPEVFVAGTHPRFDPAVSDVPFNSDLVFATAGDTDGTADMGTPSDPVRAAVNVLDGFSTSAFFDVLVSGSINPATAVAGQTVFLLQLDTGANDALDAANVVGIKGLAEFDVQVVSLDGGSNNALRLRPLAPLAAKSKYLVVVTNGIKDAAGSALTRSLAYNTLRDPSYETLSALLPVRAAILGWETLASEFLATASNGQLTVAAAKEQLVLTYSFTTTDPQTPLLAMAAPRAAVAAAQIAEGVAQAAAVSNALVLDGDNLLPTPKARPLAVSSLTGVDFASFSSQFAADVGKLYTGYIKLPYYQSAPSQAGAFDYLQRNWRPDQALAAALGRELPADVDGSYNVTYRYPFAAKTADISVPLQVTMPANAWVPGYAGAANCGQIYAVTGYPVVLYVHGITSDRTSVLALAHTLASRCVATVAIDLPVHGVPANSALVNALNVEHSKLIPFATLYGDNAPQERHFNVAGSAGAPAAMNFTTPASSDGSGAQFINLGYLANTRDNNRQAVMDLLNLNASLASLNEQLQASLELGIDTNRLYVVGVSLGGILSNVFTTVNQLAIASDVEMGLTSSLNPVRGLVMSAAATQVGQVLINSNTFAPVINAGLAASGVNTGTSNYERFMYVAQSTLDSADPVNFSQTLATLGVPLLLQQIKDDAVIPNRVASAPLAGTEAMAKLLDSSQLKPGVTHLGRGYVKLNAGGHVSLLRPEGEAPQVTAELQAQVVTLVLGNGNVAVGTVASDNIELPSAE